MAAASAARRELERVVRFWTAALPKAAFPMVPFAIAATFQVFAWFGGRFLHGFSLVPRVLILWMFALGEYSFMSPAMNASQEVLGMSENMLIIMYNVATLLVFTIISSLVFRNTVTWRHAAALVLLVASVALVHW